ncbi:MAG: FprA family A-type flavoprotein, partial [Planctomycetes bacterium]|nr:FprA family A-type flavoprotein [Planctomycetota bacterium]
MTDAFQAVKVSDRVWWVGAVDWSVRDFHGYQTSRGTTYNAYLVMADTPALIDTVKPGFLGEMFSRIASVTDPSRIRVIVSNHSEMDHSGCLPETVARIRPDKVLASKMGARALQDHFGPSFAATPVADGETLSLGNATLTFLETRMLHWPDSMVSYLAEERLLFSQDAFGMHLATSERFADEVPDDVLNAEAAKYFANILTPFSPLILKLLERVQGLKIPIDLVAPDHGPIWRKDAGRMPALYAKWAVQEPGRKAVVVYDTMWQSTAAMARAVGEGLARGGASVKIHNLKASHRSDVATELLGAGALLVGSSTLNNNMLPSAADALTYLRGLKFRNLAGGAFGSHGWSGEGAKQVREVLEAMKVE